MDISSRSISNIPRLNATKRPLNASNSSYDGNHFRDDSTSNKSHWSYLKRLYLSLKILLDVIKMKYKLRRNSYWLKNLIYFTIGFLIIYFLTNFLYRINNTELNNKMNENIQNLHRLEDEFTEFKKQRNDVADKRLELPTGFEIFLKSSQLKDYLKIFADEKFDTIVKRNLNEKLGPLIEQEIRIIIEKLIKYELTAEINEQILKKIDLVLDDKIKQRTTINLEFNNETLLNNSIKNQIKKLILDKNLEDKNLKPDYASELNNAFVIDASSTYKEKGVITLFWIPLWSLSSSPSQLLKRNPNLLFENYSKPWKMDGKEGFIKIRLAKSIIPTSFSYEHVVQSNVLDENQLTCSPKVFRAFGFVDENSVEPIALGKFKFEIGQTTETEFMFDIKESIKISIIQFNIEDNHGNPNYTCLHRIKVF